MSLVEAADRKDFRVSDSPRMPTTVVRHIRVGKYDQCVDQTWREHGLSVV